jgi:hypothetical protein
MSDEKKKVDIEDLPVPLKELDKEEEDNVTGGIIAVLNPAVSSTTNPTTTDTTKSAINPLNPTNKTFNP